MIKLKDLILEDEIKDMDTKSSGFMSSLKNFFKDKRSEFEVDKHKDTFIEFTTEMSDLIQTGIKLKRQDKDKTKVELEKLQKQWEEIKKKYIKFKDIKMLSDLIDKCDTLVSSIFRIDSAVSMMVAGKYKEEYEDILKTIKKSIDDFENKLDK